MKTSGVLKQSCESISSSPQVARSLSLPLTRCIILNPLTIKMFNDCMDPPHLWMPIIFSPVKKFRDEGGPAMGSDSLLHPEANTERYYLSLNRGKKLNNPWGCRVGDYEAAKLCWQLCCSESSVLCLTLINASQWLLRQPQPPSLNSKEVLRLRATQFYYCRGQVGGRWATIAKWPEMKLNLGECRYFPFPHCCICKQWGTFQMGGMRLWLVERSGSRVVCSQLLPTSVSAVVSSRLGLHRSWQCCSLKAQR